MTSQELSERLTPMTIQALIERLEALRAELDPKALSAAEFEQVGWARRPLQGLIDQAREEAELQRGTAERARTATALLADAPLTEAAAVALLRKTRGRRPNGRASTGSRTAGNSP